MTPREEMEHGHRVAMALEIVDPVIERMVTALTDQMIETSPGKPDEILTMHGQLQAIRALKDKLRQAVIAGTTASLIEENKE